MPSEYAKHLYYDSCCFFGPALMMAHGIVGADHILWGSDDPYLGVDTAHVDDLPIGEFKIDRSFVAGLQESPANLAIVRAVVGLAEGLGMAVTAEGIEREDQLVALRDAGCDRGQGFLFARPRPAAEAGRALLGAEAAA